MSRNASRWQQGFVIVGGLALFLAMATDAAAVIGRHVGLPLRGSIELVQAFVLVSGSLAMVLATVSGEHARVHLLVDRVPPRVQAVLRRCGLLCGALFFAALFVACFLIARDVWSGQEESELLHVAYWPLRMLSVLATLGVAGLFLRQALARRES
jgi:TRAP-type C4-dicarboxylate transport system permease small subunit